MLTNTDAPLYHRRYNPVTRLDEWESTYIPALWWYEAEQSSVTTEGDVYKRQLLHSRRLLPQIPQYCPQRPARTLRHPVRHLSPHL